jgi:20S proteasome subunit alpha 3
MGSDANTNLPPPELSVEFAILTLDPETKQPKAKIYRPHEIDALLVSEGLTKKEGEGDKDVEMGK